MTRMFGCVLFLSIWLYVNAVTLPGMRNAEQELNALEQSYNRANIFIKFRSANGRMILLLCKRYTNCQKLRRSIPEWIREYNSRNNYSDSEYIHYYYYSLGKPLDFMNSTSEYNLPVLVYVMALKPYFYSGDLQSHSNVMKWIQEMDSYNMVVPQNLTEVSNLLMTDDYSNCTTKYLVFINNEKECSSNQWPIIARVASKEHNVTAVHLKSPLPAEILVALQHQMPSLDEGSCQQLFLIHQDSYSIQLTGHATEEMSFIIQQLLSQNDNSTCPVLLEEFWNPIMPALSELQIQFFSEEHLLRELEHKVSYVLVGIAGGCAVCTLAFSIFWGLNGSAFAK